MKALAGVAQLVRASSHKPKGHGLDSWSGHIPRLGVQSLVRVHMRGNGLMFLSHITVFLSPSFLFSPLSKINNHALG